MLQALNLIAINNPNTTATMIDGAFFQDEVEERKILAVPMVFQDNQAYRSRSYDFGRNRG